MTVWQALLLFAAVPVSVLCAYLLALTLLSSSVPLVQRGGRVWRFDVVIPAHNEAASIERTIASIKAVDWPSGARRIIVVADNCTDSTAAIAKLAGAHVLIRENQSDRGKGFALAHAFDASRTHGFADALVVVDADSEVSANLLQAFAARLDAGAMAIQAHYGVLNVHASWRTRLMAVALGAFHTLRSRAREQLRLSCGIRGNGWCISHELLQIVPYNAFSLAEDIEFGIDIGTAGHRVVYCEEAHVLGEMVTSERSARSQRRRWEGGRSILIRRSLGSLLSAAIRRPSRVCADLALDLMTPPLATLAILVGTLSVLAAIAPQAGRSTALTYLLCLDVFSILAYVMRGWMLSGTGFRGLLDLLRAPFFVVWKLMVTVSYRTPSTWTRTDRET